MMQVKQIAKVVLTAILIWSIVKIFSVDDALINFIVLGQLPATDIYLDFWSMLVINMVLVFGAWQLIKTLHSDFIAFKLEEANKDALKAIENNAAKSKQAHANEVAQQLEIDELDVISL